MRRSCFVENMWNYLSFDRFEEESGLQSILIALKASQELRFLNHDFLAGVREIICVNSLLSYKCTRCWFHNHFMYSRIYPSWIPPRSFGLQVRLDRSAIFILISDLIIEVQHRDFTIRRSSVSKALILKGYI
ncbi:hypothetical protein NC653_013680 [Populus alba x Populus x berolinensis]|uniref:Uncharacterized protein n=1 Tax=Populus alba x Populus x berolinensis TaxID=444605 RepID=A0AAD6QV80_9ROSI|nr:hypothetical protein NC653_013680 [Populus alba x Populus x berolinensis]